MPVSDRDVATFVRLISLRNYGNIFSFKPWVSGVSVKEIIEISKTVDNMLYFPADRVDFAYDDVVAYTIPSKIPRSILRRYARDISEIGFDVAVRNAAKILIKPDNYSDDVLLIFENIMNRNVVRMNENVTSR